MPRKKYSAKFKFQVALEALQNPDTPDAEIARQYDVHPVTLSNWKRTLLENGASVFESGGGEVAALEKKVADLERVLGQKEVELALMRNFAQRR